MIGRDTIYVRIYTDRMVVKNMDSGTSEEVRRDMQHASPRMLVANFTTVQQQLKDAVKKVRRGLLGPVYCCTRWS